MPLPASPPPIDPDRPPSADIRALLLTDVVDSTGLSEQLGDAAMALVWAAHDRLARDLLPLHQGREIDKTDGMLLMFDSAASALQFAGAYHQGLDSLAAGLPFTLPAPLRARAGLHVGPVMLRHNSAEDVARGAKPLEVDGLAKPVTARVMSVAQGGQTLLTAEAHAALAASAGTPVLQSHGHWLLKGVAMPMELFEADSNLAAFKAPADGDKAWRVVNVAGRWLPVREVPNNLPLQASSFVGREREIDELKGLLADHRLVTLLGAWAAWARPGCRCRWPPRCAPISGAAARRDLHRPDRSRRRCRPAAVREGRIRRLPRVRHPGPRLAEAALRRLRPRQAGRLLLQAARLLPLVRGPAHGADDGAPGRPRHPPRAGAPVGAVTADPAFARHRQSTRLSVSGLSDCWPHSPSW